MAIKHKLKESWIDVLREEIDMEFNVFDKKLRESLKRGLDKRWKALEKKRKDLFLSKGQEEQSKLVA